MPRRKQFEHTNKHEFFSKCRWRRTTEQYRIDTKEEDKVRIEYENLTQARENQDKPEEPIKIVKEVIKHTVCRTNTSRKRKHTWKGGETGPKNYQHRRYKQKHKHFRGKKNFQTTSET